MEEMEELTELRASDYMGDEWKEAETVVVAPPCAGCAGSAARRKRQRRTLKLLLTSKEC